MSFQILPSMHCFVIVMLCDMKCKVQITNNLLTSYIRAYDVNSYLKIRTFKSIRQDKYVIIYINDDIEFNILLKSLVNVENKIHVICPVMARYCSIIINNLKSFNKT